MATHSQRSLSFYLPLWTAAKSPFARRAVIYAATAAGDTDVASYLTACLGDATQGLVERALQVSL